MKTVIEEANDRVQKYKKENPLTIEQILNTNLCDYYENLMVEQIKKVSNERAIKMLNSQIDEIDYKIVLLSTVKTENKILLSRSLNELLKESEVLKDSILSIQLAAL